MNNDILPPKRPQNTPPVSPAPTTVSSPAPQQPAAYVQQPTPPQNDFNAEHLERSARLREYADDVSDTPPPSKEDIKEARKRKFRWVKRLLIFLAVLMVLAGIAVGVFFYLLIPVTSAQSDKQKLVIEKGMSPVEIATKLQKEGFIRNELAFRIYAKLTKTENNLQAGTYRLMKSESTPDIIKHLTLGSTDSMNITFFPGATLKDTTTKDEKKRTDVTSVLLRAGYSQDEIQKALKQQYKHPLFAGKPASAGLEGYVFGETYNIPTESSVADILKATFDEYDKILKKNAIEERGKKLGLNMFQVITLASIIEREVSCQDRSKTCDDQKMVSQVFHKRLKEGIQLGSDVTFIYAANQMGVEPRVNLESPYNTRIKTGMPPGPIATPGLGALIAAVDPAKTDYLYFVAGDDGKTHFSKTETDHEVNVKVYCKKLCQ